MSQETFYLPNYVWKQADFISSSQQYELLLYSTREKP
jgi:hypothetical protein